MNKTKVQVKLDKLLVFVRTENRSEDSFVYRCMPIGPSTVRCAKLPVDLQQQLVEFVGTAYARQVLDEGEAYEIEHEEEG